MADWASGGSWEPPPESEYPITADRAHGEWGREVERGPYGIVAGRFDPLHRGHQLVIDVARQSVQNLTVFVFEGPDPAIPGSTRAHWIRESYRDVDVVLVPGPLPQGGDFAEQFAATIRKHVKAPSHLFASELQYRSVASALGAEFVPIDPARMTIPTSGTAIRANVMENFVYLAPATRPWFVRRVAVVGAESTGKTTLCNRLHAELKVPVVPEWTRIVAEAGDRRLRAEDVQSIARIQLASEEALARQTDRATGAVLVSDTDLLTLLLWTKRLYRNVPPHWIEHVLVDRDYDLHLVCMPDIPFVGSPGRDDPAGRRAFHDELVADLRRRNQTIVEVTGTRDECFQIAADAIISLYTPKELTSKRARWLNKRLTPRK